MNLRCLLLALGVVCAAGCSLTTDFERFDGLGADGYSDASFHAQPGDGGLFDGDVGDGGQLPPLEPGDVRVTRSGEGTITSEPAGILCGDQCTGSFAVGTKVTLRAAAAEGAAFASWGGACAGLGPMEPCVVTAGEPVEVAADFAPAEELMVVRAGHGSGVVSSSDGRIRCDGTADEVCRAPVPHGAQVELVASSSADGSTFSGWGGACMGTEPCKLTMSAARMVNAVFDSAGEVSLIVSKVGAGEGSVESAPVGISCGNDCSEAYPAGENAQVVLTAMPFEGSSFVAFTGCASTSGNTCTVQMGAVRSVNAEFALMRHTLSVAWAGKGAGKVMASAPEGLSCSKPGACSRQYDHGTEVTLVAAPAEGSSFVSWSGGGCGASPTCSITLGDDVLVVANFALNSYAVTAGAVGEGELLCDGTLCAGSFMVDYGTKLSFGSEPEDGWELSAWGGACAGKDAHGACDLTITKTTNVIATFSARSYVAHLTVEGKGAISGTLSHQGASSPVSCSAGACNLEVQHGDTLALSAQADSDFNFAGWSGLCGGTGACNLTVRGELSVGASFSPEGEKVLALKKTGKGTVTSTPAGIACGPACQGESAPFAAGSTVQLALAPAPGYAFGGLSGCSAGDTPGTCSVKMSDDVQDVSVVFSPNSTQVDVVVTQADGKGQGTVSGTGISCSAGAGDCRENRPFDSTLVLTAKAAANSEFEGWGGDCSGLSDTCNLTIDDSAGLSVSATFRIKTYSVQVTRTGGFDSASTVSFAPGGAPCGEGASECRQFDHGTDVTLTAQPGAGSMFTRWSNALGSGPCHNSTSVTCALPALDRAQALTAQFSARTYNVGVTVEGPGSVSSSETPPRISCSSAGGGSCSVGYPHGAVVTLSANTPANMRFLGWGGACADYAQEPTCTLSVTAARNVSAAFKGVRKLSVVLAGDGVGTLAPLVTGTGGISCATQGGTCVVMLDHGSNVSLSAVAPKWATFAGFSDNCKSSGAGSCSFQLNADTSVEARFDARGALVFVTSATVTGKLGPMRGAALGDLLCTELARKQQLPGPWVAWLSDSKSHPIRTKNLAGRLKKLKVKSKTPLLRTDGAIVAKNGMRDVALGALQNPISLDETGTLQSTGERGRGVPVWTATLPIGFRNDDDAPYCDDWSSADALKSIKEGVGDSMAVDGTFTTRESGIVIGPIALTPSCDKPLHLYCVRDYVGGDDGGDEDQQN
jgi:hypothetical protein